MRFSLRVSPPKIIETRGKGVFEPARPEPFTGPPRDYMRMFLLARKDYLSVFRKGDYRSHVSQMRGLGRQLILVNVPEHVKYVLATRHDNFERKSPAMRRALEYLLGDGLFISDGETWKQRRPLVSDIVHKNRLPQFAGHMEEVALELVRRWQELPPETVVDALAEMGGLTAEIIARAVFGDDISPGDASEVVAGFTSFQSLVDNINLAYVAGFDNGIPLLKTPRLRRAISRVRGVIDRVTVNHLEGRNQDGSMLDLLVRRQQKNPELGLDRNALRNEAATIFMAGQETTAATLTWIWYLLANAPWAEAAVHAEIERVCGSGPPTLNDVPKLDYCRAVVEETLRLYPPVPLLGRQAREADRIAGIDVLPSALVTVSPWLLHRNPDLWKRPHHFMPERFLGGARPVPYSYIPFAIGPRICAGLQFGMTETILCLAILAQRFKVRLAPGTTVRPASRLTLRPQHGLPVTIHPR
ncbi:cytochrome P450 [Pararhizobium sp. BT-229]|uniref:cytochrome P450 n=1 Tax=Pararhizobium sp. BT-229 TaxID=2986923 RepID=UPI0021F7FA3A|nr:cytochrome P450 [Pararhizobium sp. BT-229]MCV9963067.1 cytochrome P450 [Pararhizobium sp. BT-229]